MLETTLETPRCSDWNASELPFVSGDRFLQKTFTEQQWLIDSYWPAGGCGFIAGPPKSYKSWLALDLALAVVTGDRFLGHQIGHPGPVLLFDAESIPNQLQQRLALLAAGRNLQPADLEDLHVLTPSRLGLDRKDDWDSFAGAIFDYKAKLAIVDPLVRFHGLDENSASDMAPLLTNLRNATADCGASLVIVHHTNKAMDGARRVNGNSLRGSSDLYGWLDAALYARTRKSGLKVHFESRYSMAPDPVKVQLLVDNDEACIEVTDGPAGSNDKAQQIVQLLQESVDGFTEREIRKQLKLSGTYFNRYVDSLMDSGSVTVSTPADETAVKYFIAQE